jgi:hypothetical protein
MECGEGKRDDVESSSRRRREEKGCGDDEEYGIGTNKEEVIVAEDVLSSLIEYCDSPSFMNQIEAFKRKNCHLFARFDEEKHSDEDQPLELYEIFLGYQSILETLIRNYAERVKVSESRIFQNCRDVGKLLECNVS